MAEKRKTGPVGSDSGQKVKKKKLTGEETDRQRFLDTYSQEFPCLKQVRDQPFRAYCVVCRSDFGVSHMGMADCKRHCEGKKHIANAARMENTRTIGNFLAPKPDLNDSAIEAEVRFSTFLVKHNLPIAPSDHAGALFRAMFPDSNIAKKYASGRTKTTQIVVSRGKDQQDELVDRMKSGPFVIGTDGSQEGGEKYFPITVKTLESEKTE